jgi:prevent-host-death family protein
MKSVNLAEFKAHLSAFIQDVQNGEGLQVCKRNVPVARLLPAEGPQRNHTKLGCGVGTGEILCDPTEPGIPEDDWDMLSGDLRSAGQDEPAA